MKELADISLQTDTWGEEHARRVVAAACRKIEEFLHAKLIRVYRREAAKGRELLRPLATIYEAEPDPQVGNISVGPEPDGPISWTVHNKKPLWLEDITEQDEETGKNNLLDKEDIEGKYLNFTYKPSAMLVIPLLHEDNLVGVLAIELEQSGVLKEAFIETIRSICRSIARIIYKSSTHQNNLADTTTAVEDFLNKLQKFKFETGLLRESTRTGFIARPFGGEFDEIGSAVTRYFLGRSILTSHCKPNGSGTVMIDQIVKDINNAHFHIADVTGANPNVMMEVGMILNLDLHDGPEKVATSQRLFMRKEGDAASLPFDLAHYQIYDYRFDQDNKTLTIKGGGDQGFQPFEGFVSGFVDRLMEDPSFKAAKPHTPAN